MGSYNQKIQNGEPSPTNFSNLSEFRVPQNIQDTGQHEKLDEIKDLYIAMRQSIFQCFPISSVMSSDIHVMGISQKYLSHQSL